MPRAALAVTPVDHVSTLAAMPELLLALAQPVEDAVHPAEISESLRRENAAAWGGIDMEQLKTIGQPSAFSCPDCGGVLFELDDQRPVRYRCHTGHGFSLRSLAATLEEVTDGALWTGLRALQEKQAVLRRLVAAEADPTTPIAAACLEEARELSVVIDALRNLTLQAPSATGLD